MRKRKLYRHTPKPTSIKEAEEWILLAQQKYVEALREYNRHLHSGKPGKQRRSNQLTQTKRALEEAKADLEELRNPEPTLFP